jgi:hypothetical protein
MYCMLYRDRQWRRRPITCLPMAFPAYQFGPSSFAPFALATMQIEAKLTHRNGPMYISSLKFLAHRRSPDTRRRSNPRQKPNQPTTHGHVPEQASESRLFHAVALWVLRSVDREPVV